MNNVRASSSGWKGYGLVRDGDGKPVIDGDPYLLPQEIKDLLTDQEYLDIFKQVRN